MIVNVRLLKGNSNDMSHSHIHTHMFMMVCTFGAICGGNKVGKWFCCYGLDWVQNDHFAHNPAENVY